MITAASLRQKYLDFFTTRGHKVIPSASLVPENDSTTLFTSSGMQPLVPYLLGQPHPSGKRLVNSQPSFRYQDIKEVGNNRHTTFFEMLGNWSLGDYFKKEQISWLWEFLTQELSLPQDKLYVTVFAGTKDIPEDRESIKIWQSLGIPDNHIYKYDVTKNWWSRSGPPDQMPAGEPGGTTSEIFYKFTQVKHNPKFGQKCHPNCDCGRFLEIGNSVFMEYKKETNSDLARLPKKNVDFGGGLERLVAVVNNNPDIFKTDLFGPIIKVIEKTSGKKYGDLSKSMRIIADHLKAAIFIIDAGIRPSNKKQGSILRRLIRRAVFEIEHQLSAPTRKLIPAICQQIVKIYSDSYFKHKSYEFAVTIGDEAEKFSQVLPRGIKYLNSQPKITAEIAFNSLATYGVPFEISQKIAEQRGETISKDKLDQLIQEHTQKSRTASAGMFKGGLADHSEITTKYHTTTHLLQQALRDVLGDHVLQAGSNITEERLRFDFTHNKALTDEEAKKIENTINSKIKDNLPVTSKTMPYQQAIDSGVLAFFKARYPETVTVYSIGNYSQEICAGPHVTQTKLIGTIKIARQESVGANTRRLYLQLTA